MSLGAFFDRLGSNIADAPRESWFTLANALSAAPRNRPLQGLAQGLAGFAQTAAAGRKRKAMMDMFASSDMTPMQRSLLKQFPDIAVPAMARNAFDMPKAAEKPNAVREYEYAVGQGFKGTFQDYEQAMRRAGASSVNVNNMPAEMGARVGLGEGFLEQFDDIKATAKKFYGGGAYEQVKRRGQMFFNTGEGGKLWRDVETGKESLVRNLTGAGMAIQEATQQASRYSLSPYDTEYDALTKLEGLRRDLINTARGAFRARGGVYTPPATSEHSDVDKILGLD